MDGNEMAVMVAALSDPEFKTRLAALREEIAACDAQKQEMQAIAEHNAELLQQAREERAAAEATLAAAAERGRQTDEETAGLAAANTALTEEKARWEALRQGVEARQEAKDKELRAVVAEMKRLKKEVEAGQAEQADREDWLKRNEQQMAVAMEHAQKFVEVFHGPLA